MVPVVGKFVVDATTMVVPDPPVPAVSSLRAPLRVEVIPEAPPYVDVPQPKPAVGSAGPSFI